MKPDADSGLNLFAAMTRTDVLTYTCKAPGMDAFALSDAVVYHIYTHRIPKA